MGAGGAMSGGGGGLTGGTGSGSGAAKERRRVGDAGAKSRRREALADNGDQFRGESPHERAETARLGGGLAYIAAECGVHLGQAVSTGLCFGRSRSRSRLKHPPPISKPHTQSIPKSQNHAHLHSHRHWDQTPEGPKGLTSRPTDTCKPAGKQAANLDPRRARWRSTHPARSIPIHTQAQASKQPTKNE